MSLGRLSQQKLGLWGRIKRVMLTDVGALVRGLKEGNLEELEQVLLEADFGVPATMAMFPFTGWDDSFYGDLHIQGKEAVQFYTRQKVVTTRWFGEGVSDVWKK